MTDQLLPDGFVQAAAIATAPVAMLDDDPTGAQEAAGAAVLFDWSRDLLARLPERCFHVITNSRSMSAEGAFAVTRDAAAAVLERFPNIEIALRGDSTLRAHLREEYEAVQCVAWPDAAPALLLVPALPAAGRVTVDGVHLLERGGVFTPIAATEYARDGAFAYRNSRLLDWAEERSNGLFAAAAGVEVPLEELRRVGGAAVRDALGACVEGSQSAVCAPDAVTIGDLELIVAGVRQAREDGIPLIVRCAPSFATVLCRTRAMRTLPAPEARSVLVVCGSYVPQTTRQLAQLLDRRPGALVEIEIDPLLGEARHTEVDRAAGVARDLLSRSGLAVVATPRARSGIADDPTAAGKITTALAELTGTVADSVDLVVFKGGITSAVGVRDGLGGRLVTVEGPVLPGVSLWRLEDGRRCLVFPGNVGDDDSLADLIDAVLGR